jgi:uncharacterized damage-inducible protein DinB
LPTLEYFQSLGFKRLAMEHEAWLEGPIEGVLPILMPAAHSLVQSARDINRVLSIRSPDEIITKLYGAPSVAFHLAHIAGSIDRLLTYSRGESLTEIQFSALRVESEVDQLADPNSLLQSALDGINTAISTICATPPEILFEPRFVGRSNLPTTVFGLLFHIAEHTQRHTGQIIATASIVGRGTV